ncbi:hypothetical protein [Nocardia aurea]|uniref:hypothetical protein n=1 Tax=Nocardia aurea TaxID=2144174 RepID=UPI0033A5874D
MHEDNSAARRRGERHVRELWSDRAEHRFDREVLDRLGTEVTRYGLALAALDIEFDRATKLLGTPA